MAGSLMPLGKLWVPDNNGLPLAGGQLFVYEAGTTTKLAIYLDSNLTIPATNPVILDAAGRCAIFVGPDALKQVLASPTDSDPPLSPIWTVDGIIPGAAGSSGGTTPTVINSDVSGTAGEALALGDVAYMSDGSGSLTAGYWYLASSDHNYSSTDAPTRGIVTTAASAGNLATVRVQGRCTLAVSLSQGDVYYIDSTAGQLSTSETQDNLCPFGQADSPTSIVFPIAATFSATGGKNALATFAYGGAAVTGTNANNAGGGNTELTGYQVTVPQNYLSQPGACLVVEGLLALANNANAKTMSVSMGTSGVLVLFANSTAHASHYVPFRFTIIRRSDTVAVATGIFYYGGTNQDQVYCWLANHVLSGTVDWATAMDLKFYVASAAANDIMMTDMVVSSNRALIGKTV